MEVPHESLNMEDEPLSLHTSCETGIPPNDYRCLGGGMFLTSQQNIGRSDDSSLESNFDSCWLSDHQSLRPQCKPLSLDQNEAFEQVIIDPCIRDEEAQYRSRADASCRATVSRLASTALQRSIFNEQFGDQSNFGISDFVPNRFSTN